MIKRLIYYYITFISIVFVLIFSADYLFKKSTSDTIPIVKLELLINTIKSHCNFITCEDGYEIPNAKSRIIKSSSLALPEFQKSNFEKNRVIKVIEGNELYYYIKLDQNYTIEVGPTKYEQAIYWSLYSVSFYILLGLSFFMIIFPLFKEMWQIKEVTEKFSNTKNLANLTMPDSVFFMPVTNTINWMLIKIARLLALQSELSSTLSHELRTNLSRLKFTLAGMSEKNLEQSKTLLYEDVNEIQSLIEQYLSFAKQEHEQPNLDLNVVKISDTVKKHIEQLNVYSNKKIIFNVENEPTILADMSFLSRAIKNIIDNAFKYTKDTVIVSIIKNENMLCLKVEDNGSGIESTEVETLFLPYARNQSDKLGYGLGLAITKKIIDWHHGIIEVNRSQTLGGAEFCVYIPTHFKAQ